MITNMTSLVHKACPSLLAQKLNSDAAFCIETGRYDRAIFNLVEALKLSEQVVCNSTCTCQHCSLDGCLTFSQKVPGFERRSSSQSVTSESENGYIYRRPIVVPPQAMQKGHSGVLILPLIITFNLALAHHLSSIEEKQLDRKRLKKVMRLYELAHGWQLEEDNEQFDCIRFTMIISNNLGEIHRAVNNRSKYVMCLQHLLSTMMFMVVDCHQTDDSLELDGFLRNTSPLILQGRCAAAA
jgi:hypothetical protein